MNTYRKELYSFYGLNVDLMFERIQIKKSHLRKVVNFYEIKIDIPYSSLCEDGAALNNDQYGDFLSRASRINSRRTTVDLI
jgi:hypothetical protein